MSAIEIKATGASGYIQSLIDDASPGDTIYIPSGTYYENIIIDVSITLIGEDKETTIIDGGGNGDVVFISADEVTISGFTLRNSGSGEWPDVWAGIEVDSASNIITDNIVTSNEYDGMFLDFSDNNTIKGNAISLNNGSGIELWFSCNNSIIDNNINSNYFCGILLEVFSNNNIIMSNHISPNNYNGVYLSYSGNNTIVDNNIFIFSCSPDMTPV